MLFFRSEELIRQWCKCHSHPLRPTVPLAQLWQLAWSWYSNRLDPSARRPGPAEMREIFERIGLTGDYWDAQSKRFDGNGI